MEALIVGFSAEDETRLEKSLPGLSAYDTVFTREAEHRLDESVSLAVYSRKEFDLSAVCDELRRRPELIVYVECGYGDFLRLDPANQGTAAELARAIDTAAIARDLSLSVRHSVRSPIQTIYECSRAALEASSLGDETETVANLELINRAASRIYTAVDDFNDFHSRIEQLLGVLASMTPSDMSSSGS